MGSVVIQAILGVVVAVVAIAGGLYLVRAERKSFRPTERERGPTATYTERAGARFGTPNWTPADRCYD